MPSAKNETYAAILSSYQKWCDEPDPVPKGWAQRRGYEFERMLNALFTLEQLDPRTNYRPDGEEIDGSLVVDNRTYLIEAKWWKNALPASQLYAFKGKIDGKLAGTLGIAISHSGFADDAVDALVSGKGVNMILFDGKDIRSVLNERVSFTDALRQKLRYAAEYGQPFKPIEPDTDVTTTSSAVDVIVEGSSDEAGLRVLIETFLPQLAPRVAIWPALGRSNLLSLSQDLAQQGHSDITMFLDTDGLDLASLTEIKTAAQESGLNLITFTPSFIGVLENACDTDYYNAVPPTGIPDKHARRMARNANLEWLWRESSDLHDWWVRRTNE
ncbi:MAG: hypothetical protein EOP31_17910 [Rhodococcus sp. (in: high G+C Gram-positive bacteria)]|uniref:restriction endonuclease n=1 Tax=Rhodococcus sp. TaxID=1831 RepID=UPI0012143408|nr:restriction endonuclease [Rhodococcus sp. (in: high G+C Gram-positive bacteria)]RZL23524.1 MAG: hypothetical protein EOP31_17910 [Rhodococcus sp. (in: high G+C Gram-positive bacteria)]